MTRWTKHRQNIFKYWAGSRWSNKLEEKPKVMCSDLCSLSKIVELSTINCVSRAADFIINSFSLWFHHSFINSILSWSSIWKISLLWVFRCVHLLKKMEITLNNWGGGRKPLSFLGQWKRFVFERILPTFWPLIFKPHSRLEGLLIHI